MHAYLVKSGRIEEALEISKKDESVLLYEMACEYVIKSVKRSYKKAFDIAS